MKQYNVTIIWIVISLLLFANISEANSKNRRFYQKLSKEDSKNLIYKGYYKVGKKYKIKGKYYTPKKISRFKQTGIASWYGAADGFHGKITANGDMFNKNMLTAAHKTLPMPSLVRVTNLENNKKLIVMINDRGPFSNNRILDMSETSAKILGYKDKGVARIRVEYLPKETAKFLKQLGIKTTEGSRTAIKKNTHKCSINCYIKLHNLEKNYRIK